MGGKLLYSGLETCFVPSTYRHWEQNTSQIQILHHVEGIGGGGVIICVLLAILAVPEILGRVVNAIVADLGYHGIERAQIPLPVLSVRASN